MFVPCRVPSVSCVCVSCSLCQKLFCPVEIVCPGQIEHRNSFVCSVAGQCLPLWRSARVASLCHAFIPTIENESSFCTHCCSSLTSSRLTLRDRFNCNGTTTHWDSTSCLLAAACASLSLQIRCFDCLTFTLAVWTLCPSPTRCSDEIAAADQQMNESFATEWQCGLDSIVLVECLHTAP